MHLKVWDGAWGLGSVHDVRALTLPATRARERAGNTPLVWAADGGHVDAVRALLATPEAAATVNVQGYLGATAVCRACLLYTSPSPRD